MFSTTASNLAASEKATTNHNPGGADYNQAVHSWHISGHSEELYSQREVTT